MHERDSETKIGVEPFVNLYTQPEAVRGFGTYIRATFLIADLT